ncbi:MAG: PQQ-binding-like beta-propeller repeat protein, partial [Haliea sp.]
MQRLHRVLLGIGFMFGMAGCAQKSDVLADAVTAAVEGNQSTLAEQHLTGEDLYATVCATCHEAGVPRAPSQQMMTFIAPRALYRALTEGVMQPMAAALTERQKVDVVEYITGNKLVLADAEPDITWCSGANAGFDYRRPPRSSGWGMTHGNTREVSGELAGINRDNVGKLKLRWAVGMPDTARMRSQPMIAGGALFVGSQGGTVYSLDMASGCARWSFLARSEVRTAIIVSSWEAGDDSAQPLVYFGDYLGNVYALDAITGTLVWNARPDEHPNATISGAPALYQGTLYVPVSSLEVTSAIRSTYPCCTFRGSVVAYDAQSGDRQWKTYTIADEPSLQGQNKAGADQYAPSGAPVWNSPAIDVARNQLLVGTGQNYSSPATATSDSIIAMDLGSGQVNWVFQATVGDAWNAACEMDDRKNCPEEDGPDVDFGGPPIIASTSDGRD